jgi:Rps23 Pro-64 3,4-dihydroxylase Tpa1-like proline 4-hydroxylase
MDTDREIGVVEAGQGSGPAILRDDLSQLADQYRESYLASPPWPHVVIDSLFDPAIIAAAELEELEPALGFEIKRRARMVKAQSPVPSGPAAKEILQALDSPPFVAFLEDLTGISGLIADPTHYWAGLHVFPPGAYQSLHSDFLVHPVNGLAHRVNVLVYLNGDWKDEYEGNLELWKHDMTSHDRIAPRAGSTVIFETSSATLHAVADPVRCPPGRARLSLATNYFATSPGPDHLKESRFRRPKRPQDPWYMGFRLRRSS